MSKGDTINKTLENRTLFLSRRETASRLGTRPFNNGNTRGGGGNRRGQTRGRSSGNRGGAGSRGGSRGRGAKRGPPPSKEDLDKELDSYIEAVWDIFLCTKCFCFFLFMFILIQET